MIIRLMATKMERARFHTVANFEVCLIGRQLNESRVSVELSVSISKIYCFPVSTCW